MSNSALQALLPTLQSNNLSNISLQGMSQASMMFISMDYKSQKEFYNKFNMTGSRRKLDNFFELCIANKKTFYKYNITELVLADLLASGIDLARKFTIN